MANGTFVPMPWWLAGPALGGITLVLLFVANRRLGVSGGLDNVCSLVSDRPFFRRAAGERWRLWFLGGLLLGGALSAVTANGWHPTWVIGMFDAVVGWNEPAKLAWMFVGGILVGFGTRLANGCTSGHGIFGLSNFEPASLLSTLGFMAAGAITTNLVYRVVFG
jgi:uncharacterized membrane protein YedE/YeeE